MKRIMSVVLSFSMLMSLAACGKSNDTKVTASENQSEDQVQEDIKSDNETATQQEEESNGSSDAQPEITTELPGDSIDTPVAGGSGNPDDYWNGSYFDIVNYLRDSGADDVFGTDGTSLVATDSNIEVYVATFYNNKWHILVNDGSVTLAHVFYDENNGGRQTFDPCYTPLYDLEEVGDLVTVNAEGLQIREKILEQLFIIVECIKADKNSNDPLSSSGLQYSNFPW